MAFNYSVYGENMITESQASLYLDNNGNNGYAIGVAMMEPYGMKGWLCEIPFEATHPYAAIDRALHLLFVIGCRHVMIGSSSRRCFDEIESNFAMFEYRYETCRFDVPDQNRLFKEAFAITSLLSPIEHLSLEERPLCAQALAMLSQRLLESDKAPFALPMILETETLMETGNNALEQLEVTSIDPKLPSIAKIMLMMSTPMGKRLGRFRLFLPIQDAAELNRRYDWIQAANPHARWLQSELRNVGDIELAWWLCQNNQVSAESIAQLTDSVSRVVQIRDYLAKHKVVSLLPPEALLTGWLQEIASRCTHRQWIDEQIPHVRELIEWIARIDVAVISALVAEKYALTRPMIVEEAKEHFLQAMGLRHLLVEAQGIAYVPNDIVMGQRDYLDLPYPTTVMLDSRVHDGADISGLLLYGINSSGKSSLMKSIGIAAVLAQAGFFVPAKSMKFSLFDGIYTRIMSRDNVAKSLSTFGVEMLELNTIFSRATSRSLVIGDEISHGTETLSAVAIVASTIIELARKGTLFLMTTHLHQLSMIHELSRLREVVSLHLSVRYDEKSDQLIYDRILKPGRGSSVYGLEFAESLHMNRQFLDNAKRLRENLAKEYDVLELGHQKEYIKRYREISACECVICGSLIRNKAAIPSAKEHHHLIPLCEKHRTRIAEGKIKPRGLIMTPQGLRLEYETQL